MYKTVIGLEVHCELKTNSKVFSSGKNEYSEIPNSCLAPVDLGYPGILPVLNKEAVRKAIKTAMALNCEIPEYIVFDRKNYFYPDLPKGYQITQMHHPFGINGYLMINADGEDKKVLIHDLHLEEDTASLDHFGNYSLINYNRSGIPLIEIVTEPVMNSASEALAFLDSLRKIFLYCEVSEARSDRGQMRCDVNISLMKEDATKLGTKVEIKNINSFNSVKEALEYEIKRQTEVLNNGGTIIQETRRYDDDLQETISMRSKVEAVDYKYFVEPNIPMMKLDQDWLIEIKKSIPKLQFERLNNYMSEYGLSRYDATILVKEREVAEYFEETLQLGGDPKKMANWINGIIMGHMNKFELNITEVFVTPKMLKSLVDQIDEGKINVKQAKEVMYQAMSEKKNPLDIIKSANISQITDDKEIRQMVEEIINRSPEMVEKYQNGRNVLDYFVGQIMKQTKGKVNPMKASTMFKEVLDRR